MSTRTAGRRCTHSGRGRWEAGGDDLPQAHYLDAHEPVVREAIERLLNGTAPIPPGALRQALGLASTTIAPQNILALAETALSSGILRVRPVWAFAAFILDPERHAGLLTTELADAESQGMFGGMWEGRLGALVTLSNDKIVARSEALIRHLGPNHGPSRRLQGPVERLSEVVGGAITHLSQQLTEDAAAAFTRLVAAPENPLCVAGHPAASSGPAVRCSPSGAVDTLPCRARWRWRWLPVHRRVPADLRAVVRHTLDELVIDIRHGDTSPWRGFWNWPSRSAATPKVENDCRDLLTDRLRDRLERLTFQFGGQAPKIAAPLTAGPTCWCWARVPQRCRSRSSAIGTPNCGRPSPTN